MGGFLDFIKQNKAWSVIGIITVTVFALYLFLPWFYDREVKIEGFIKTDLGDEFYIVHEVCYFPKIITFIEVYRVPYHRIGFLIKLCNEKNLITQFNKKGENFTISMTTLADEQDIRCYLLLDELIYKKKGEDKFKALNMIFHDPDRAPELIPVVKKMVAKNEWRWMKVFAEFLIKAQDQEVIDVLFKYAQGEFTNEERRVNKDSDISQQEMQEFSIKILRRYGIL